MSDSIRMPGSKLSFITIMLTKLRSLAAPAPIRPPMESMASFSSLADRGWSCPLIEERGEETREPELAFRVRRAPGPDQHPHAHHRLFVVQDGNHLQSVRQRSNLVGRKLDVARGERTGRPLGRPVADLR